MVHMSMHISRLLCAGFLMAGVGFAGAQSAASYPNKPVRIIVPFGPGGAVTTVITALGDRVSKELGQNFINDYRPGADTALGIGIAAKATADGYTLLEATSSYVVNHWLNPDLPFDSIKDLTPITMMARSNYVLVVHTSVPNTLKDFISYAKANPGKLNMGYVGSVALVNFQLFMNVAGIKFTPVPYKAGPLAAAALLNGEHVGNITGLAPFEAFIRAGRLKALAVTGDKRSPVLPDVPTFAEAGLKEFNTYNWFALLAPGKTPKDIIRKLNAQFRKAQEAPEAISMLAKVNVETFPTTVEEAEKFIRAEAALYGKLVKESGLKAGGN